MVKKVGLEAREKVLLFTLRAWAVLDLEVMAPVPPLVASIYYGDQQIHIKFKNVKNS